MKIKIHIGSHKTGSTAIQRALLENKDLLQRHGYVYPQIGFWYYGHHKLVELLSNGELPSELQRTFETVDGHMVFSSENFSNLAEGAIRRLFDLVKDHECEIVYYQRNPLELIYVWWQEIVKHGSCDSFLQHCANSLLRPRAQSLLQPWEVINKWSYVFGRENVSIYLYEGLDAPNHFLEKVLDIPFKSENNFKNINKSFDPISAECIRFLNSRKEKGLQIMQSSAAKDLMKGAKEFLKVYLEKLELSFECPVFRDIESNLLKDWKSCIKNQPDANDLFSVRSLVVEYLDIDVWYKESAFADQLLARASGENFS